MKQINVEPNTKYKLKVDVGNVNIDLNKISDAGIIIWKADEIFNSEPIVTTDISNLNGTYELPFTTNSNTSSIIIQIYIMLKDSTQDSLHFSLSNLVLEEVKGGLLYSINYNKLKGYLYGYNSMERQEELNSLPYDFGARLYDPRRGQFPTPDPDIYKYPYNSSYLYGANNPIRYVDINGKGPGDKVVIFSGAILIPGIQKPSKTMYDVMESVTQHSGHVSLIYSTYIENDDKIIERTVQEIKDWRAANPTGELAVVGYSYGGVLAMKLTRELDKLNIPVELLVTLDAANGNKSDKIDRNIPSNVKKNINYYQRNETDSKIKNRYIASKGNINRAQNSNKTEIINIDLTNDKINNVNINHYNIDQDCVPDICKEIKNSQDPD